MSEPVEIVGRPSDRLRAVLSFAARMATRASITSGIAATLIWWNIGSRRVGDWPGGTLRSLLVLALLLAPAAWLLNVRVALTSVRDLPGTLQDVARRRGPQLRDALSDPYASPSFPSVRSGGRAIRDYGDVAGSWATVAQIVTPQFWLFTVAALFLTGALTSIALVTTLSRLLF